MRVDRGRTKKLIVAFHFHAAESERAVLTGWNCEQCRRQGLEAKRRCGFLPEERRGPRRAVWARGSVATEECPKSLVTAESLEMLEKYFVWKFSGGGGLLEMRARETDAFLALDGELRRSRESGVRS
jgi:hypothetical protein